MLNQKRRNTLLFILMVVTSGVAVALRPIHKISEQRPLESLEAIVPASFGDWREEKQASVQVIDPQQQASIDRIYSQTLSRTYINRDGYRVMLSVAYGTNQRDDFQVHKPEVCYPAQGFVLADRQTGRLALSTGTIPVTRILTTQGQRVEPVTYWTTLGDQVVQSSVQKKRAELKHAFRREIADGMLVRFSSLDVNTQRAYALQEAFAAQLIDALAPDAKTRFAGNEDQN